MIVDTLKLIEKIMKLLNTLSFKPLLFLLSLLVLGSHVVEAHLAWVPGDYYGIPDRDKQIAFYDEFENNDSNWDFGSLYLKERIEDSDFYCETLTSHPYTKRRPVAMNHSGNYEIEIRMRFVNVKGSGLSMTGLTFGRDVRGNEYSFMFSPSRSYRVAKFDRGRSQDLVPLSYGKNINRYSYNTLLVRKVSDKWYFFINEELVSEMVASPLFGNEYGFTVGGNMAVEVDYLKVSEIRTVDNMGPQISLIEPSLKNGETGKFSDHQQIIRGRVYDVSGVDGVVINGYNVTINEEGLFAASLSLRPGLTEIQIEAKDKFENISKEKFYMELVEEPRPAFQPPVATNFANQNAGREQNMAMPGKGKNYLLLIGVNEYTYWNRLHNAVKDCSDLSKVLTSYYQFDQANVITLFNEEATRENILETLESLQDVLNKEDNLVIYYAGHGYYDEQASLGYWVPSNARLNKIPDFIGNSTIHDYLRTINSKHTLLIADACYAGSLFANTRGVVDENNRSRWAFTSGDIEKVWDGQPGQNSPFARCLIRILQSNTKSKLRADELIQIVSDLVARNTAQTPKGDALRNVGDDGGVFTFERR
ncbi:MAG: caspase family protein [Bacteroidia bacterium]